MTYQIVNADVLEWAKTYDGPKFHALFCDAPYEIEFMGNTWDAQGIAFNSETWRGLARHLLPGAFLFVYAGTRHDDLISVAMRQAGLVKHHSIKGWTYGQGFTKATRIDTRIDEAAGAERVSIPGKWADRGKGIDGPTFRNPNGDETRLDTLPATPLAKTWVGHRYGQQTLQPGVETILVFQKPYEGKPIESITKTGAGALNIDGGRLSGPEHTINTWDDNAHPFGDGAGNAFTSRKQSGRWPKNFFLAHSPACVRVGERKIKAINGGGGLNKDGINDGSRSIYGTFGKRDLPSNVGKGDADGLETVDAYECLMACECGRAWTGAALTPCVCGQMPEWGCPVAAIGEQSGMLKSGEAPETGFVRHAPQKSNYIYGKGRGMWDDEGRPLTNVLYGDEGTAARFYFNADWQYEVAEQIDSTAPFRYEAKASDEDRNQGVRNFYWAKDESVSIGFRRITFAEWQTLPRKAKAHANIHPTVKPISLNQWLATLILPPAAYAPRRILIPFSGSGSETIGTLLAGWEEITAVEREPEYVALNESRLAWYVARKPNEKQLTLFPPTPEPQAPAEKQLGIFDLSQKMRGSG